MSDSFVNVVPTLHTHRNRIKTSIKTNPIRLDKSNEDQDVRKIIDDVKPQQTEEETESNLSMAEDVSVASTKWLVVVLAVVIVLLVVIIVYYVLQHNKQMTNNKTETLDADIPINQEQSDPTFTKDDLLTKLNNLNNINDEDQQSETTDYKSNVINTKSSKNLSSLNPNTRPDNLSYIVEITESDNESAPIEDFYKTLRDSSTPNLKNLNDYQNKVVRDELTDELTGELTDKLTGELTDKLTGELTDKLTDTPVITANEID
jgi:hypothetical protein